MVGANCKGVIMTRKMYDKRNDHSQSHFWGDLKGYYCHKKGNIRRYCEELTKYLETRTNCESQETSNSINIIDEEFGNKCDIHFVIVNENFIDSWILDFGSSFMCPYKE